MAWFLWEGPLEPCASVLRRTAHPLGAFQPSYYAPTSPHFNWHSAPNQWPIPATRRYLFQNYSLLQHLVLLTVAELGVLPADTKLCTRVVGTQRMTFPRWPSALINTALNMQIRAPGGRGNSLRYAFLPLSLPSGQHHGYVYISGYSEHAEPYRIKKIVVVERLVFTDVQIHLLDFMRL